MGNLQLVSEVDVYNYKGAKWKDKKQRQMQKLVEREMMMRLARTKKNKRIQPLCATFQLWRGCSCPRRHIFVTHRATESSASVKAMTLGNRAGGGEYLAFFPPARAEVRCMNIGSLKWLERRTRHVDQEKRNNDVIVKNYYQCVWFPSYKYSIFLLT